MTIEEEKSSGVVGIIAAKTRIKYINQKGGETTDGQTEIQERESDGETQQRNQHSESSGNKSGGKGDEKIRRQYQCKVEKAIKQNKEGTQRIQAEINRPWETINHQTTKGQELESTETQSPKEEDEVKEGERRRQEERKKRERREKLKETKENGRKGNYKGKKQRLHREKKKPKKQR